MAVKVEDFAQRRGEVQIVDVREQDEWDAGHLPGSIHLPLSRVAAQMDSIDKSRPVVVVCRTGPRSIRAAELLREHEFDAQNLSGGLTAWVEAGHSLARLDGDPGIVLPPDEPELLAPDLAETRDNFLEVIFGLQERYGNREPTDEEAREFMREWLTKKGRSPEEIERILAGG